MYMCNRAMDLLFSGCNESALDVLSRAALMLECSNSSVASHQQHQPDRSGSNMSTGMLSSVAPVKRSLSADRQQTLTSDHHHDNEHLHQPRPTSSPSLSLLQRPSSSSSLGRKCPRLDLLEVGVSLHQSHPHHVHHQLQQQADSTHKCAGTQTFLSSFLSPSLENNHHHRHQHNESHKHADCSRSSHTDDVPLNLSLSSASYRALRHHTDSNPHDPPCTTSVTPLQRRHHRPSHEMDDVIPHQSTLRRPESSPCLRPEIRKSSSAVITVDCDRDIEEHFRRSLGRDYCNYMNQSTGDATIRQSSAQWNGAVTCSAPCSGDNATSRALICDSSFDSKKCSAISITGSVDDHFAKSLGSAWTHIKSSLGGVDPVPANSSFVRTNHCSGPPSQDAPTDNSICEPPGSVDDHFAKALGDAWFRIKAEHEGLVAETDALNQPC